MGDQHFFEQIRLSAAQREGTLPETALPPTFKTIGALSLLIVDRAQAVHEMALTLIAAGADLEDEPRCLETVLAFKSITGVMRPREVVLDCIDDARARASDLIKRGVSIDVAS